MSKPQRLQAKQKSVKTFRAAQDLVKVFAESRGWVDAPNIDKFDHLHEELLEMSRYLRYKDIEARIAFIETNREIFIDGIGDLLFGVCRLANQLNVDLDEAFNKAKEVIFEKYATVGPEGKLISFSKQ